MSPAALAARAGVSAGVIKGLIDEGCLLERFETPEAAFPEPDVARPAAPLNPSQAAAAEALKGLIAAGGFHAALIDGVTGSGKTEVYLEAVAELLRAEPDAQVLVLLPEIALTQAVLARFEDR
jgi:primosomal protein N' (replication factor Y)